MLFQKIFEIAQGTALTLTFTANREAGTLNVVVIPKMTDEKANPALFQPMSFEASPEELETEFANVLGAYSSSRMTLSDALKNAEAVMEAAKKEATEKAGKAVKSATGKSGKPADTPVPVTVTASGPAQPAIVSGDDNLFADEE